jgi:hypothetical protein
MDTDEEEYRRKGTLSGACFALRFLVHPEYRVGARHGMEGFSDSAIFHRRMDLLFTLREPEGVAFLTPEEKEYLMEFNALFESLPWRPIESHPHISEVPDEELSKLVPSAKRLLESLERRI